MSANVVWVVLLFVNRVWWDLINVLLAWHVCAVHTLTHTHTHTGQGNKQPICWSKREKKTSIQWIINAIFTVFASLLFMFENGFLWQTMERAERRMKKKNSIWAPAGSQSRTCKRFITKYLHYHNAPGTHTSLTERKRKSQFISGNISDKE